MDDWTIWSLIAAAMLVAEMMTGTFYLLVMAIGAACAAMSAYFLAPPDLQIGVAVMVSATGFVILQKIHPMSSRRAAESNPDVNPDIGAVVRLSSVLGQGRGMVQYRGAAWTAHVEGAAPSLDQDYEIVRVEGNILILGVVKNN